MADADLETLLALQDIDIALDQLRHRRESIPERRALAEQQAAMARIDAELAGVHERLAELQRSQRRLEDEVAGIEEKAGQADRTLYSGTVSNPRELQALQEEIEALGRRRRKLEDDLLDLMEAAEPLEEDVSRMEARRDELGMQADGLRGVIADVEAAIAVEVTEAEQRRADVVAALPADLLETYEGLRPRLEGVAVARLEGGRCQGCHLALPATELDAAKRARAGAVVRHEECGRILVRTG